MKSFFSIFNARLLVIHFVAFWFFMYGFQTLAFLHDYKFLYLDHIVRINSPSRFDADTAIIEQLGNFGLIAAYIISWSISIKKGWHWVNSVVVFLFAFAIENLILLHWVWFRNIYLSPGGPFKVYSKWGHIVLGIGLLGVGSFLVFSKKIMRYIDHSTLKDKQTTAAKKKAARTGKVKMK